MVCGRQKMWRLARQVFDRVWQKKHPADDKVMSLCLSLCQPVCVCPVIVSALVSVALNGLL